MNSKLSHEYVVATTSAMIDPDGTDRFSMRRFGAELGFVLHERLGLRGLSTLKRLYHRTPHVPTRARLPLLHSCPGGFGEMAPRGGSSLSVAIVRIA